MSKRTLPSQALAVFSALLLCFSVVARADDGDSILKHFKKIKTIASTVPGNGDVNPYGLFQVPRSVGNLTEGHFLVSNFNASTNFQGTGTTIVDIAPNGTLTQFAQISLSATQTCPGGVGLTTALGVLKTGWVIVGSLPTSDGTSATAQAGCLIVLDSYGNVAETFYGSLINGPWDMAVEDGEHSAKLFVTNVLQGAVAANGNVVNTGTVLRINLCVSEKNMPSIESMTVIGSGFPVRTDPAALVIGPTGVGLSGDGDSDRDDGPGRVLYVADSLKNRIAAIPDATRRTNSAGTGATLTWGGSLNDPLGLTVAPNGHILVVNGDDGYATEITPDGHQIARALLDSTGTPPGNGALFGVIFVPGLGVIYVDDASNTLNGLE
jgi:hypothetical protein